MLHTQCCIVAPHWYWHCGIVNDMDIVMLVYHGIVILFHDCIVLFHLSMSDDKPRKRAVSPTKNTFNKGIIKLNITNKE